MSNKDNKGLMSAIITVLYLMVHFVSDFGGADVMGAQWLYTSTLDLAVLVYIFINKTIYKEAIAAIFNYKFTLLFSLLVLWAIGSYFYAINPTETLVTLARLISTYLVFIQVSILFYKKDIKYIFNIVSFAIAFLLLWDSFYILKGFSRNIETMDLDANIVSLSGNHGNKNVMAASLLIKFPFVLWLIINHKSFLKIINIGVLFFGVVALFIMNTRSTYVGLGIIFLIYAISTSIFVGITNKSKAAIQVAYFLGPIIVGFFVANLLLANAVELFHNFTLVHDDMMDAASLRRGKTTVHIKYGDNTALLVGDVMMIRAYEYIQKIQSAQLSKILQIFNTTAKEVCEGQQLDMDFEKMEKVSLDEYIEMITLKTSVLLAASLEMGAVIGGASENNCKQLYEFGKKIGIAFQIQDDYLDAFGDAALFGKEPGGDIKQNKKTFLLIHALEVANEKQKADLHDLIKSNPADKVEKVLAIFKDCKVDEWAEQLKAKYMNEAFAHLENIAVVEKRKQPIIELAHYLMNRTK